ncbi:MAG: helix-turn-helix domain-containing protein [Lachnospiraceae bacterium]|nr:helix-turn-helix domain-containing protein [Lachnospiraceae bacterium]
MNFKDRLKKLMDVLGANGSQIAEYAHFDRTNVSRLINGRRNPSISSPTVQKLVKGICLFAEDKNALDTLCALVGISPDASEEEICAALTFWLFKDLEADQYALDAAKASGNKKKAAKNLSSDYFSERFNAVLALTDFSNIRLSRLISVDASLISRYRSGTRTLRSNPKIAHRLSEALFTRIEKLDKKEELARVMDIPADSLDEAYFSGWLCGIDLAASDNISAAESLLEAFGSYSTETGQSLPSFEEAVDNDILNDTTDTYYGYAGLQQAAIRFLGNAVKLGVGELLLYSDQSMDWMVTDPSFRAKWAALMSECVRHGIRMRIIHNIDRDLEEMSKAITAWLPLYMSGMIEPYYCTRPEGSRFSHTLFLCPGHFCIQAFHSVGNGPRGLYHFYTSTEDIAVCARDYSKLLENSEPLIRIIPEDGADAPSGSTTRILNSLSVASMPETLAKSFSSPALKKYHQTRSAVFHNLLKNADITECITLADHKKLSAGKACLETLQGIEDLRYTPEQYAEHIKNLIRLLDEYPSYHLIVLPEVPFTNLSITIGGDYVKISRITKPYIAMTFNHPLMCRSFDFYAENLTKQHRIDRNFLKRMLEERYL